MKNSLLVISLIIGVLASVAVQGQEAVSATEAMKLFGYDLETIEIKVETVADGLHVLKGAGGNIVVSIGEQGVLLVDDQLPEMVPRITSAIAELGGGEIDFVVNTHWHFDHADGNALLGSTGSWIVAHANSRKMMTSAKQVNFVSLLIDQPVYPDEGLPVITFRDHMQFHFNGEQIDLFYFGPAHTSGDSAVVFRGGNIVHMGDVFRGGRYPFIDADNGGELDGVIGFCESVLKEIDENTVVIPGHGQVATYADLVDYVSMLKTIRTRIRVLVEQGATLEEIIAAGPTADWDAERGSPDQFLDRAFTGMKR